MGVLRLFEFSLYGRIQNTMGEVKILRKNTFICDTRKIGYNAVSPW